MDDSITTQENVAVLMKCVSIGNPTPTNTWITPNTTTNRINNNTAMFSNGSLIIQQVERDAGGVYKCVADHGVGVKVMEETQLNVLCKLITFFFILVFFCLFVYR